MATLLSRAARMRPGPPAAGPGWALRVGGALLVCALGAQALAAERKVRTPQEVVALVQRAVLYVKQVGRERALQEFNRPNGAFVDGELYIFAYNADGDGVLRANVAYPLMVNKNLLDMTDPDGVQITRRILAIGNSKAGKGWLDYHWPNAMNGKVVELKSSYVERAGPLIVGCGIAKQWAGGAPGRPR